MDSSWGILAHDPGKLTRCALCNSPELSFEHLPPRSCFNRTCAKGWIWDGVMRQHRGIYQMQRGLGRESLCRGCNSIHGTKYVPHFESWSIQAKELVDRTRTEFAQREFHISPYYVSKQLATMAVAMGHESYIGTQWFDRLRAIARGESTRLLPSEISFWAYLVPGAEVRLAGIAHEVRYKNLPSATVYCEIARHPLGYVMMWNEPSARILAKAIGLTPLDHLFHLQYKPSSLVLPVTLRFRKLRPMSFAPLEYEGLTSSIEKWRQ